MPTVLVENVGMSANQAQLIAGFVELMFPVGNTLPALALDKLGRKRTMMVGCSILSACMLSISVVSLGQKGDEGNVMLTHFSASELRKSEDVGGFHCFLLPLHAGLWRHCQCRPVGLGTGDTAP